MADQDRKLFLGGRLKRLRHDLSLTQTRMAEDLGISPSYLNHLERNQRPLTAQMLLKLAATYDLDLRAFSEDPDGRGEADLTEVLADPLFTDLPVSRHDIREVVSQSPGIAEALVRLYRAHRDQQRRGGLATDPLSAPDPEAPRDPSDWVRDHIQAQRNHFAELDAAGEALAEQLDAPPSERASRASAWLMAHHGLSVRTLPVEVMTEYQRRYDPHRRRLLLSETLSEPSRAFALAYQCGLMAHQPLVNQLTDAARAPDLATQRLLKISLLNYLAGAILMPYGRFHTAAEDLAYDLNILTARFGVSVEQAAHRLTTLSRPGARGVPFFLIRTDSAGNVSKRFAAGPFPFSRLGGACPRWNLHTVFKTPGRIRTQIIETPDGARFFTLSTTVSRPSGPWHAAEDAAERAIGLGCELKYADKLIYARGLDLSGPGITTVGPTCRLCERLHCRERAEAPLTRTLMPDEWAKTHTAYPFAGS
ncbi:MAG: short-chain fatty acyl-CoA regulator family protein [Asticcacaulis sp.]